jgi:hypothetical protein
MKFSLALAFTVSTLSLPLVAQEAPPKPVRKPLASPATGTTSAPPKAAAVSKPAEKPAPKATPKPVEKVAEKPPAKPTESAPDKEATPAVVTSTVPPEPSQIARAFFGLLAAGDVEGAYAGLMKGSNIAERPDEVRSLKTKTRQAIEIFGTIHGYDLIDIKPVGERLMRTTYLSLGHELPLRWRFYFYKADAEWRLIDIRVDDKLNGIFDEAPEDPPQPQADARP